MITNKIIFIEIALVVITTVRHTSADDRIALCEKLIKEVDIFYKEEDDGPSNFRHAYKHLTLHKINKVIDKLPGNSENASMRAEQKHLTKGYFQCLLNGINEINGDLSFDMPDIWCWERVRFLKDNGHFEENDLNIHHVKECKRFIIGPMLKKEDVQNGELGILKALYERWCGEMFEALIKEYSVIHSQFYTMAYYNHVGTYVRDERHDPARFKSIKQYCTDEGYELLKQN